MSIGDLGIGSDKKISQSVNDQQAIIDYLNTLHVADLQVATNAGTDALQWMFFPLAEGSGATLADISGNVTDNMTLNQACNWTQQAVGQPDQCFNVNNVNQAYMFDNPATLTSLYQIMNTNDVGSGDYLVLFNIFTTSVTGSDIGTVLSYGNGTAADNDPFYILRILVGGSMQMNLDEGISTATTSHVFDANAWNTFGMHFTSGSNNFYVNDNATPNTDTTLNMLGIDVPQTTARGIGLGASAANASPLFLLGADTGAREVYLGGFFVLKTNFSITNLIQPIVEGWYDQKNPFKLPEVLLQVGA